MSKNVIDTKKLSTGAFIEFFADGRYKFWPSQKYNTKVANIRINVRKSTKSNCSKLIDDIFKFCKV